MACWVNLRWQSRVRMRNLRVCLFAWYLWIMMVTSSISFVRNCLQSIPKIPKENWVRFNGSTPLWPPEICKVLTLNWWNVGRCKCNGESPGIDVSSPLLYLKRTWIVWCKWRTITPQNPYCCCTFTTKSIVFTVVAGRAPLYRLHFHPLRDQNSHSEGSGS